MGPQLITVLMPVHNGEKYLALAIESILSQTYQDFEFVIVNDASTDTTAEIISRFNDARIRVLTNNSVCGIAASLNAGLAVAQGEYVARMDADDISMPRRLAVQADFLSRNPGFMIVGSWAQVIDSRGNLLAWARPPANPALLKWQMLFRNAMIHTSVMFRRKEIVQCGAYNRAAPAEDYELWSRVIRDGSLAVVPQVLVKWREHDAGYNIKHFDERAACGIQNARENIRILLNEEITIEEMKDLYALAGRHTLPGSDRLAAAARNIHQLFVAARNRICASRRERELISRDCCIKTAFIASKHADYQKNGTGAILRKTISYTWRSAFNIDIWICLLKLVAGQRIINILRNAREQ